MKQDRNGVRTAQDLERKYSKLLVSGKKANEQSADGINEVKKILENFSNEVAQNFESVQRELDSLAETWFYAGAPTLANLPASEWPIDKFKDHVGDLYYDTDTGYAYRFVEAEEGHSWEQTKDKDIVEALALANSANDTADSKRRVFMTQPMPPYDNGDLWIYDQELYVCQISKGEEEEYVDEDFVVATKYTDDTLASQVGDNLEIVRGDVEVAQEKAEEATVRVDGAESTIKQLCDRIAMLVVSEDGTTTLLDQTVEGWSFNFAEVESALNAANELLEVYGDKLDGIGDGETIGGIINSINTLLADVVTRTAYVDVKTETDESGNVYPYLELGKRDDASGFKVRITNSSMLFMYGSDTPLSLEVDEEGHSYVKTNVLVVDSELKQGKFSWLVHNGGANFGLAWKG